MKKKTEIRGAIYDNDIEINRLREKLAEFQESVKNLREHDIRYVDKGQSTLRNLNYRLGEKRALEWVLFDEIKVM